MPLTRREQLALYEIFECSHPDIAEVVSTSGGGMVAFPSLTSPGTSLKERIAEAIRVINTNQVMADRVAEIVAAYLDFSTDPSPISREGYEFRASRNLPALRQALFPYTGIIFNQSSSVGGRMSLG